MWIVWSLLSMLFYAVCEVFQKKGSDIGEEHPELKMLVWFGIANLAAALVIRAAGLTAPGVSAGTMIRERPGIILSPALYFVSLFLSFVSLKLVPLTVAAPIISSDGVFTFIGILFLYFFRGKEALVDETVTPLKIVLAGLVVAGIYASGAIGDREEDRELNRRLAGEHSIFRSGRFAVIGILFAVLSAMLDAGSSLTDIYILSDIADSFEYIYVHNLLMALFCAGVYILLWVLEKKPYDPFKKTELPRMLGACCDCLGLVFYMVAVAEEPAYAAVLIPAYCIVTVFLSKVLLGEKTGKRQKLCIALTIVAILVFAVVDELF